MKGPEDDAGLAGKVAIVAGGGAAGDGIGNGRAAAILLARAGTPEPMVNLLHNAVRIALATPEVREQFRNAAVDAGGMPPAEYREIIRNDLVKWKTLVDRLQIKLD